jgi:hypothetical protein
MAGDARVFKDLMFCKRALVAGDEQVLVIELKLIRRGFQG